MNDLLFNIILGALYLVGLFLAYNIGRLRERRKHMEKEIEKLEKENA